MSGPGSVSWRRFVVGGFSPASPTEPIQNSSWSIINIDNHVLRAVCTPRFSWYVEVVCSYDFVVEGTFVWKGSSLCLRDLSIGTLLLDWGDETVGRLCGHWDILFVREFTVSP